MDCESREHRLLRPISLVLFYTPGGAADSQIVAEIGQSVAELSPENDLLKMAAFRRLEF